MSLRIVFMGTPDFAIAPLVAILGQGHEVAAVYTQPARPAGRGMAERRSSVHQRADLFGLCVETPALLRSDEALARFKDLNADVAVVVAYGQILPADALSMPRYGCLNIHASLLPRWRGAAPIQRAIMAGDHTTGVSIMQMDEGLDTGAIGLIEKTPITSEDTAQSLHDRLSQLGADAIARALAALERGSLLFEPQPVEGACYAHKITKAETRIDWSLGVDEIHNKIRGLSPFPGAWCEMRFGTGAPERVKVLRCAPFNPSCSKQGHGHDALFASCADGQIALLELQRSGKKALDARSFLRGVEPPIDII